MDDVNSNFLKALTELLNEHDQKVSELSDVRKVLDNMKKSHAEFEEKSIKILGALKTGLEEMQGENKGLKQDLQSVFKGLEELRQENIKLKQENENLKRLGATWNKHLQDNTRHVNRINGATEKNLARAKEANNKRADETNVKIFRAIFGYLQQAQDKSRVDMSWLLQTTGLSESSIRQAVKEVQEHKLDNHIVNQADGTYLFYGLAVPVEFLHWYKKGNFFNVPR